MSRFLIKFPRLLIVLCLFCACASIDDSSPDDCRHCGAQQYGSNRDTTYCDAPYDFVCSCNVSVQLCDVLGDELCFCDSDCEGLSCTNDGVCERRCDIDPDCQWGCTCDRLFGLCNTVEPGVAEPCTCDVDCLSALPCALDDFCDHDCPHDPDCPPEPDDGPQQNGQFCSCDRLLNVCEPALEVADVCACDPDC